jgi:peptidoglycan/LPS O-acetylase OafA/YrhL
VIVIVVVFPLIVALGAGASVTPRIERLCRFSGDMSYPLYMTHYGMMWIWGDYAAKHHLVASTTLWTEIALGVCVTVAFAWVILRVYDQPVRRYLSVTYRE